MHCKDKIQKFRNKYSQKRNIGVSVPISTFIRLWVIYIFPQSVCLFCWRKYVDRSWDYINRLYRHMNVEIGAEAALFPENEYINGILVAVCSTIHYLTGLLNIWTMQVLYLPEHPRACRGPRWGPGTPCSWTWRPSWCPPGTPSPHSWGCSLQQAELIPSLTHRRIRILKKATFFASLELGSLSTL